MIRKSFCAGVLTLALLIPALAADFTWSFAHGASVLTSLASSSSTPLWRSTFARLRHAALPGRNWPVLGSRSAADATESCRAGTCSTFGD